MQARQESPHLVRKRLSRDINMIKKKLADYDRLYFNDKKIRDLPDLGSASSNSNNKQQPGELADKLIFDREYHRIDSANLQYRQLPEIVDVQNLLKPGGPLDATEDNTNNSSVRVFLENTKISKDEENFLNSMIVDVYDYGIVSVDTENEKTEDLVINFGTFHGFVAIFKKFDDIPRTFIDILENPYICKIGAGMKNDIEHLAEKNVNLSNFVDTCRYFITFVRKSQPGDSSRTTAPPNGTEAQAAFLGFKTYPYIKKNPRRGEGRFCNFKPGHRRPFGKYELLHMVHDLRVPFAILLKSVVIMAQETNIMQGVHYRLACLVSLYPPKVLLPIKESEPTLFPLPKPDDSSLPAAKIFDYYGSSLIHSLWTVQRQVKMSLYYGKYFPSMYCATQPRNRFQIAVKFWGGDVELPASDECKKSFHSFKNQCRKCASDGHNSEECPERFFPCTYPLCDSWNRTKHSILTCFELHSVCSKCKRRGHTKDKHQSLILPQLEAAFLAYSHLGYFTSMPFLLASPNAADRCKLKEWHWQNSLYGNGSVAATKLAAQLDLPWTPTKRSTRVLPPIMLESGENSPVRAHLSASYVPPRRSGKSRPARYSRMDDWELGLCSDPSDSGDDLTVYYNGSKYHYPNI